MANGKIYKIVDINFTDHVVGSTVQPLSKRMSDLRDMYKKYKEGKGKHQEAFDFFDKHGGNQCKIFLVEDYNCESKEELLKRAAYHRVQQVDSSESTTRATRRTTIRAASRPTTRETSRAASRPTTRATRRATSRQTTRATSRAASRA